MLNIKWLYSVAYYCYHYQCNCYKNTAKLMNKQVIPLSDSTPVLSSKHYHT